MFACSKYPLICRKNNVPYDILKIPLIYQKNNAPVGYGLAHTAEYIITEQSYNCVAARNLPLAIFNLQLKKAMYPLGYITFFTYSSIAAFFVLIL